VFAGVERPLHSTIKNTLLTIFEAFFTNLQSHLELKRDKIEL
jgi:hypothetical protein